MEVRRVCLFILLAAVGICTKGYSQGKYKVMAIGFYNVENFFDTLDDPQKKDEDFLPGGLHHNTTEVYNQKLHNIATVFSEMGTDMTPDGPAIIGLAELENDNVLKDLIQQPEIRSKNYGYVHYYTPDERGISTAMIYNPKYFRVLGSRPVHVPLESIGMNRPTRDVLYVCGMMAGDTVHILVNHWPSKLGGEAASDPGRRVAARVNRAIIDSLLQMEPDSKIIVMGDLNDDPACKAVTEVLNASGDRTKVSGGVLYNPWVKLHDKGLGTENYRGEWHLIDQIILSEGIMNGKNEKWKYHSSQIFNRDFLMNKFGSDKGLPHRSYTISNNWDNGYSDHFPVLVYLVEKVN